MAVTLYSDTTYSVSGLVDRIGRGEIALPELQRPFVWSTAKVRNLFDSMYKGFPVGYLLFWETGAEPGMRQIGTGDKEAVPRLLIVDGQQRLTALFSVMTGQTVVREDYSEAQLRIGFRPADGTFAVTDAAIERDPEFIPDISVLWHPDGSVKKTARVFLNRLEQKRELTEDDRDDLGSSIDRLAGLDNFPFKAFELSNQVDEEQVAEIFVRINSEAVTLNQADFILTLMSVFWEKGRRELERFSRESKQPSTSAASSFNWYIQPQPAQMLRVTIAFGFRRAVLKHAYTVLRGKDLETGRSDPGQRDRQFARLEQAQHEVLDLTHWHEFLQCLERAGFRSAKMISSENVLLYTYALWLIGRVDYAVPVDRLREVIARWFFMAHTTGRYSGSFETQFEQDVARLAGTEQAEPDAFVDTLSRLIDDTLTHDFWTITLPNELATSASKSPALMAYIAALNIHDAEPLLSTGRVRSRLDPAVLARKGIERHHLFPRGYLREQLGVTDTKQINQIANMSLVEWSDNIKIGKKPPAEYWSEQIADKQTSSERLERQQYWHALPQGWQHLRYQEFLSQRRRLMAQVVRDAYQALRGADYQPVYPAPTPTKPEQSAKSGTYYGVTLSHLLDAGLLAPGASLVPVQDDLEEIAEVTDTGLISFGEDRTYDTPSAAASAVKDGPANGWTFWLADTPEGQRSLANLRDVYLRDTGDELSARE